MSKRRRDIPEEPIKDMKERQREFMDKLFGKPKSGNMWGRKFTLFSLFFLLAMTGFVIWGVQTDRINIKEQMRFRPDEPMQQHPLIAPKDSTAR